MLVVKLFGMPQIRWNHKPLSISRQQTRLLIFRLAAENHPIHRDQLCHLFWAETDKTLAQRRLTRLLHDLRKELPCPELLLIDSETVQLAPHYLETDVEKFERVWSSKNADYDAISRAITLYLGEFLQGIKLPNYPVYESWLADNRHLWQHRFLTMLHKLIEMDIARGKHQVAIENLLHYLYFDATNEEIHHLLMGEYIAVGNRNAALQQYQRIIQCVHRSLPEVTHNTIFRSKQLPKYEN